MTATREVTSELQSVLRVHDHVPTDVSEREVHEALIARPAEYLEFIERSLVALAGDRSGIVALPSKQIFRDEVIPGDFRVMTCVIRDERKAWKVIKIIGTNYAGRTIPDQVTVGQVFLLDESDNHITHRFSGCLLSSARTGACMSLMARRLSGSTARIGVIGAGRVGYYAALFAQSLWKEADILVADRDERRAEALVRSCQDDPRPGRLEAAKFADAADADLLFLATTSRKPVVQRNETTARIVVSAGADAEEQRELGDSFADWPELWVDTFDSAHVGDLKSWSDRDLAFSAPRDVLDLFSSTARPAGSGALCISTGSALFDNLTVQYLVDRADPS